MQKHLEFEFKSLLSQEEYERLIIKFKGNRLDLQTNHYFDTPRFSLKALSCSLRVRERDTYEITFKRKKNYNNIELTQSISLEEFELMKEAGIVPEGDIANELSSLLNNQKLINFMSLSTLRMFLPYKNGILFIDKSSYCGTSDYEIEYEASSYYNGKKEFIDIIKELDIVYKKSDKKIKRAYNAFKKMH
ncbi:MAG: CYTH domain-containing protein [Bacilli bacterium]|nr:CYTH domain-containing protein [Bacilli bacterium]MDD3120872.1 CYTH domain-containing protein [Bacilli bacterium]MDD4063067.1 CYTH domain-containing protein [Bacilli bacterium]MDD4481653.1 CYTH domain-containing protein [Bacilli bacterium]MDD5183244.1 CYTH domain-containing protein [Bacilli bacterium]